MKLKLLLVLLITQIGFAQHRNCGMKQQMQHMMADPVARQNYLDFKARFEAELSKLENAQYQRLAAPAATIYIPVAVHYPTSGSASVTVKTCLRNLAQNQINILNADYNRTNSDYSNWSSDSATYPGTNSGIMNVQFVLATQNHPAGTGLVNGDLAVTFGTDFLTAGNSNCTNNCDNDSTWAGYFNLVVTNITPATAGILGYSPLGGSLTLGQTVVISKTSFASGVGCSGYVPGAPFNLGRTLTHELGHFFNLDHTFIDADDTVTNCSPADQDGIADTPKVAHASYSCPSSGSVAGCTAIPSLTMNFMDYTDDACMYMFTAGQATRMTAYYNTVAATVKANVLANNQFLATNFSIIPNPNNGLFTINLKENLDNYSVEIYDITGRTIYEKQFIHNQDLQQNISLDNSSKGIYFVSIKSDNAVLTKKIVVE